MAKCKLYLRTGADDTYIGEFPSREEAEMLYNLVKDVFKQKFGYKVKAQPVYVEQGKTKK